MEAACECCGCMVLWHSAARAWGWLSLLLGGTYWQDRFPGAHALISRGTASQRRLVSGALGGSHAAARCQATKPPEHERSAVV